MYAPWDQANLPSPTVPVERTFEGFLDLEWVKLEAAFAHVRFHVRDNLKQPLGLLHGGVICAVAETVASVATVNDVWPDGFSASGLSNSASFLRPITAGAIEVTATLRNRDRREWLWSHEFRNDRGQLCALVDVTIAVRPAPAELLSVGSE